MSDPEEQPAETPRKQSRHRPKVTQAEIEGIPASQGGSAAPASETVLRHAVELAHATQGRVRLRLPSAKNNEPLLNAMRASFERHPGIDAVNVGLASGSLVIHYDTGIYRDAACLFASLGQAGVCKGMPNAGGAAALEQTPNVSRNGATESGARTKLDEEIDAIGQEADFLAQHSALARSIVSSVKALDREIKRTTNNNIDLKILAPVGLAAFTFLEIGAAAATPMWVTLAIFSVNHFVELKAHDADVSTKPATSPLSRNHLSAE